MLITVLAILAWSLWLVALQQAGSWSSSWDRPRDSGRLDTDRTGSILALVKLLLLVGEL